MYHALDSPLAYDITDSVHEIFMFFVLTRSLQQPKNVSNPAFKHILILIIMNKLVKFISISDAFLQTTFLIQDFYTICHQKP